MNTPTPTTIDKSQANVHTQRQMRLANLLDGMPHHTVVEPEEEGFNLAVWWDGLCTSVGCIGGWTLQLMQQDGIPFGNRNAEQAAMHYLGLNPAQAGAIFYPNDEQLPLEYSEVDADHAAAVVRHLAETGEVNWPRYIQLSEDATVRRAEAED